MLHLWIIFDNLRHIVAVYCEVHTFEAFILTSFIDEGTSRTVNLDSWSLMPWTTSCVKIWKEWRRSDVIVVWDTSGVWESEVNIPKQLAGEDEPSVSPRRSRAKSIYDVVTLTRLAMVSAAETTLLVLVQSLLQLWIFCTVLLYIEFTYTLCEIFLSVLIKIQSLIVVKYWNFNAHRALRLEFFRVRTRFRSSSFRN